MLFIAITTTSKISKNKPANKKPLTMLTSEQIKVNKEKKQTYKKQQKKLHNLLHVYFEKAIKSGDIVGAGVSVVQGDSIIISDGFGKREINKTDIVNGETVFRLGSLSKGFAGVLAADLKYEGKISWDDKIVDYIPEFHFGSNKNTSEVKLAHILSHTSGTPYHSFTNLVEAGISVSSIAKRFNEVTPISLPGEVYSYQNAMFSLSQEVFKKATGNKITTTLANRFFKPLGMSTVSMDYNVLNKSNNVALPHVKRGKNWKSLPLTNKYYNAVAAGGINASSLDMAKWMRFLLGHNPEVMPKKAIEEVFHPFVALKGQSKYYQRWEGHIKSYYGFGWRIHEFKKEDSKKITKMWHHGGSVNNYRNEIAMFPEEDLGICVLLNGNSRLAKHVIPDVHKIVESVYKLSNTKDDEISNSYAAHLDFNNNPIYQ